MAEQEAETSRELLTLEELTSRSGTSVRTVRFYTTKGLVPPPIRRGRSGYYTDEHLARLELVRELQGHGYTLAAIERYLEALPADATPEELALRRAMLAPWQVESMADLTHPELEQRAARTLDDAALAMLEVLGIVRPGEDGRLRVSLSQLPVGLGLLDLGFPVEAASAAAQVYAAHGRAVAAELNEVFRTLVWPAYQEQGASADTVREVVERLKPLSIAGLVAAYESAMDETRRERIDRRTAAADQPSASRSASARRTDSR